MIKVRVWYGDVNDPADWFEALVVIDGEDKEQCTACDKMASSRLDVEEGLATLCFDCMALSLEQKEIKLEERRGGREPSVTMPFYDKIIENARELGQSEGKSAGSAVFDGNADMATYRTILKGHEDGDPEVMDMYRSPLSGEYADDRTPKSLLDWLEVPESNASDEDYSELIDAYEEAHSEAFWDEVVRVAKLQIDGDAEAGAESVGESV